jgi:phospholipid/cholesterol/gamma-HCH transport system substrate-binding protein
METRAPFIVVGAFVLAAICAVFGFVYWLHNTAGTGVRTVHHVQFEGSVSGLLVGAAVLFNGIRVGEVTNLGLAADRPRRVDATIAVASDTPVHADTKVGLDFQGLTGVPVIALEGGKEVGASTATQTLVADPAAGESMTQAARNALARVDTVLAENAEPLKSTIANLKTFTDGLAKNTGGLDSIVAGLVKMTGGGEPAVPKTIYDLSIPQEFASPKRPLGQQLVMPTPTAILLLNIPAGAQQGVSGIRGRAMGGQHSGFVADKAHSKLRKLRRRARPVALDRHAGNKSPASDRRQELPDQHGSRTDR